MLHFGPLLNCNFLRSDQQPCSNWNHFLLSSRVIKEEDKEQEKDMKNEVVHLSSERQSVPHHQPQVTRVREVWSLCEPSSAFTHLSRY